MTSHLILQQCNLTDWISQNHINIACIWTYRSMEADNCIQSLTVVCISISRHNAASKWL